MLERFDFDTMEAGDGREALEQCRKKIPDIIMLDWNMPVMDGMEFLKTYRPEQLKNGTVVIFCTTENDTTKIMEAMEAGANEYIMKPFDEELIRTKLLQMGLIE